MDRAVKFRAAAPTTGSSTSTSARCRPTRSARCARLYAWLGEPVTDEFEAGMRAWWAENAENREPHAHADPEAFGLDLDAIRPLFASYVDHAQRWITHER